MKHLRIYEEVNWSNLNPFKKSKPEVKLTIGEIRILIS